MPEIKYEIVKSLGALGEPNGKGWVKELNLIKWNDYPAKYDLREWLPDEKRMGKGLTLSHDEVVALKSMLNSIELK